MSTLEILGGMSLVLIGLAWFIFELGVMLTESFHKDDE